MHEHKDILIEAKDFPTMLQELERGFYAIPVFQREFVWDLNNKNFYVLPYHLQSLSFFITLLCISFIKSCKFIGIKISVLT